MEYSLSVFGVRGCCDGRNIQCGKGDASIGLLTYRRTDDLSISLSGNLNEPLRAQIRILLDRMRDFEVFAPTCFSTGKFVN